MGTVLLPVCRLVWFHLFHHTFVNFQQGCDDALQQPGIQAQVFYNLVTFWRVCIDILH